MAKRHYMTIDATYLPTWTKFAGIRELAQNGRDAEIQDGAPMKLEHVYRIRNGEKVGCIIISNEGTTIPRQALLVGNTTKLNDNRTIGMFGEGLKFGILALIRLGIDIKIRNGEEIWNPVIAWSDEFGAKVLAFDITTGHQFKNRVQIEILGIDHEEWASIKKKFLFLNNNYPSVKVQSGEILIDPDEAGNIYVKGMFVGNKDVKFGYNFHDADIDRDRRMVSDLYDKTSRLLSEAINNDELSDAIYELLAQNAPESRYIHYNTIDESAKIQLAKCFNAAYPDAVPAESMAQIQELSHYGTKGVEVNYTLRSLLNETLDSAEKKIKELRTSAQHQYSFSDLEEKERSNIEQAINLVSQAMDRVGMMPLKDGEVSIVDFANENLRGTYDPKEDHCRLARKILKKKSTTVRVLVHEVAHRSGQDGSKNHESMQGNIWEEIFELNSN